jgi:hypothetical protein
MSKGMIKAILITGGFLMSVSTAWAGEIWKIVDEDGNVVYTDQRPKDGSAPMDLPELSVIETDIQVNQTPAGAENVKAPTASELRNVYRDFRIIKPLPEETFWGTANTVVVTWSSRAPFTPDLNVRVFVDGKARVAPANGSVSLTLDRGEHKVFAELRDASNRRIVRTESVTFYIKQNSVNFNRARPGPRGGSG